MTLIAVPTLVSVNYVQAAYTTESSVVRDEGNQIVGFNDVSGGRYRLVDAQSHEQVRSAGSLGELFELRQRYNDEASGPGERAGFNKAWAQPRATAAEAQAEKEERLARSQSAASAIARVHGANRVHHEVEL